MNYSGPSHPPPVDDSSSKPFKKRKKLNPLSQPVTSGVAATSTETPPAPMPIQAPHPPTHQPHKYFTATPTLNNVPHDPASRSLQQHTGPIQELGVKKSLGKAHGLTSSPGATQPPPMQELALKKSLGKPHGLPPPLELQNPPPMEELRMKKSLDKSAAITGPILIKSQKPTRRRWTPAEDEALKKLVVSYGNSWASIAQHMPSRSQRTCRARWHYVLDPSIKRTQWTEEEEDIIVTYHNKFGNKWSKIAKQLEGRSAEAIRNHWNCRRDSLTAKWKGRQAKEAGAKPENSASPAWEQAPSSTVPPPLTQAPYYTSKPAADVAGAEAAPKATEQKDPADKPPEAAPPSAAKTAPAQPPGMYPSGEGAADRSNWSRVSGNERVFSADSIRTMPATPPNSACVESQSMVLPFSYKQSGASL